MNLPIAVVILAYNEEDQIADCIHAVRSFASEVIVLDSFSMDNTAEIASKAGALVFQHTFSGFGDQRNWAIDNIETKSDWHLHLDADERPTPEFIHELSQILSNGDDADAYFVPNKLILDNKWLKYSSGYPVYQVRFFNKHRLRFVNYGHGQREICTGVIKRMSSPYLHYGFSKGMSNWLEKHVRYAQNEAKQVATSGHSFFSDLKKIFADRTESRRALKRLSFRLPFRGFLRLFELLIIRRGILDGKAGLKYARMMMCYETMISIFLSSEDSTTSRNNSFEIRP